MDNGKASFTNYRVGRFIDSLQLAICLTDQHLRLRQVRDDFFYKKVTIVLR
jgi:hypothetical protein